MVQQQQRYRVLERIASGGMAEVYRAESAGLEGFKKTVAIKRVLPHLSEKKQFIGLFLDEARLSAHLNHSNCVQVFDIGAGDNTYFIVMEYVDGADLKAIMASLDASGRTMPVEVAIYICCRICDGLAYAHEARDNRKRLLGIVHRDISPPNILITRYGEVKVVDFGLAKANSQLEESEPGIIKGKFGYLSPEAASGESVDLRTDLFAVGIILWELLAGRRLFQGETDLQTVRQVQAADIPDLGRFNAAVPAELKQILAKALARDPQARFQSAQDLGAELNDLLFRLGKPVAPRDVAAVVLEVADELDRKKAETKTSVIGTLIEDAMMEFTSLQGGGSSNKFQTLHSTTSSLAAQPLDSLGGVADWGSASFGASKSASGSLSVGNLAALEDGGIGGPMQPVPVAVGRQPGLTPPLSASAEPGLSGGIATEDSLAPPPKGVSKAVIAVVALSVAAAGVAGAYLSGLF